MKVKNMKYKTREELANEKGDKIGMSIIWFVVIFFIWGVFIGICMLGTNHLEESLKNAFLSTLGIISMITCIIIYIVKLFKIWWNNES